MEIKTLSYMLIQKTDASVFDEGNTEITIDDEGGGPYLLLKQVIDKGEMEIRLDFSEIKDLVKCAKKLQKEWDNVTECRQI